MFKNIDKKNLHHAYLVEGNREAILPEILKFVENIGVKTSGNPDFCHISTDIFKIDDARNFKALCGEKGFAAGKRVFVISANNLLTEAQNTLLKIFEEPNADTVFFLNVPDKNSLLRTLVSRFYVVSARDEEGETDEALGRSPTTLGRTTGETGEAEKFLKLSQTARLDYIKNLLAESEDEETAEDSARSKAQKFLNSLEKALHGKMSKGTFDTRVFEHIFKVRKFLRMPGSSAKTLMESVALMI